MSTSDNFSVKMKKKEKKRITLHESIGLWFYIYDVNDSCNDGNLTIYFTTIVMIVYLTIIVFRFKDLSGDLTELSDMC